jgi:5'-3' exonuclease
MGVPSFFRWLVQRFPKVISDAVDESGRTQEDGMPIPVRFQGPNPNGQEFDNLYLDMNGIIHPCCHPENSAQPDSEDQMCKNVVEYIDHIVSIVRPKKILYMAIDGVAPRAKMNQQRARRFVSAKERSETAESRSDMIKEWRAQGLELPFEGDGDFEEWDSNVITPGTPFMAKLASVLRYYVVQRLNSHPGWKTLNVIFSDASCPGEGEHKIMAFIRRQRAMASYDPNTKHVLYGMDADLIMLGLATHDPHFWIIREKIDFESKKCHLCGQEGHFAWECRGDARNENEAKPENQGIKKKKAQEYQFVSISVIREYLEHDLVPLAPLTGFKWNFENAIDDFVLLCFFVGNDFLPHLPSMSIREGAIENLMALWRLNLQKMGGYLTKNGIVNMKRLVCILKEIGGLEDQILRQRSNDQKRQMDREKSRDNQRKQKEAQNKQFKARQSNSSDKSEPHNSFKWTLKKKSFDTGRIDNPTDTIKLGHDGWKHRYYLTKLRMDIKKKEDEVALDNVHKEYIMGLSWVMQYYYRGVASWSWYFPYHYAPFASGLDKAGEYDYEFVQGTPFTPLNQLMGVLPASSGHCLPESYHNLMTDEEKNITHFYPVNFERDINGKRYMWQAVALLPFIKEEDLLKAIEPCEKLLSQEESVRNSVGREYVYFNTGTKQAMAKALFALKAQSSSLMSEHEVEVYEVKGGDPERLRYDTTAPEEEDASHPLLVAAAAAIPAPNAASAPVPAALATKNQSAAQKLKEQLVTGKKRGRPEDSTDLSTAPASNSSAKRAKTGFSDITNSDKCIEINPGESNGLTGFLVPYKEMVRPGGGKDCEVKSPFAGDQRFPDLGKGRPLRVMSGIYIMPRENPHYCGILPGLTPPQQKLLREEDYLPDPRFRAGKIGPAKQMYRNGGSYGRSYSGGFGGGGGRSQVCMYVCMCVCVCVCVYVYECSSEHRKRRVHHLYMVGTCVCCAGRLQAQRELHRGCCGGQASVPARAAG